MRRRPNHSPDRCGVPKQLQLKLLAKPKEITMNKLILIVALTFALVDGAGTVTTLQPRQIPVI